MTNFSDISLSLSLCTHVAIPLPSLACLPVGVFCCDAFCLWPQQCKRIQTVGRQQVSLWMWMCLCTNANERQPFALASQSTSPGIRTIFPFGLFFLPQRSDIRHFTRRLDLLRRMAPIATWSGYDFWWIIWTVLRINYFVLPTPYSQLRISWFASFAFVGVLSKYLKLASRHEPAT